MKNKQILIIIVCMVMLGSIFFCVFKQGVFAKAEGIDLSEYSDNYYNKSLSDLDRLTYRTAASAAALQTVVIIL